MRELIDGVAKQAQHVPLFPGELEVGEAQRVQAGELVRLIAAVVPSLLRGGPVIAQAVGLDHEPQLGPRKSTRHEPA